MCQKDCGTKVGQAYFSPRWASLIGQTKRPSSEAGLASTGTRGIWRVRSARTIPILAALNIAAADIARLGDHTAAGASAGPGAELSATVSSRFPGTMPLNTTDDNYTRGYILNWNSTIERQMPGKLRRPGRIRRRIASIHTSSVLDLNAGQVPGLDRAGQPLFAKFGRTAGTNLVDGIGYSTYHSLQTQLNRRFSRGFQWNGVHLVESNWILLRRREQRRSTHQSAQLPQLQPRSSELRPDA